MTHRTRDEWGSMTRRYMLSVKESRDALSDLTELFARVEALEAENAALKAREQAGRDYLVSLTGIGSEDPMGFLIASHAALKVQVAELSEPDFFWERDNPEEGYAQERDLADATGEESVVMEMSCARTLPCYWMAATYHEINGWNVTRHKTREKAEAACAARATLTKEPDQ